MSAIRISTFWTSTKYLSAIVFKLKKVPIVFHVREWSTNSMLGRSGMLQWSSAMYVIATYDMSLISSSERVK
jgi:hypothetical protein